MRTHARGTVLLVLVTAAGLLTACAPPDVDVQEGPQAILAVQSGSATVTSVADGDEDAETLEITADEPMPRALAPGDTIVTAGPDAMVDIAWSDGALTRLGPDTTFTVGDPAGMLGARGRQDGGLTWNRVSPTGDTTAYAVDVEGSGRTRDRGELFVVDCREQPCRVRASGGAGGDGSLTSVRRNAVETVVDSARLATWAELMSDEWAQRSAGLDSDAGLTPVEDLFADADPSRGVLEGTFDVVRTGVEAQCTGPLCADLHILQPGKVRELTFVFHSDCAADGGCQASVDTQTISTLDGTLLDATTPLVAGADQYTWGTDDRRALCIWTYADGSTEEVGSALNTVRWSVTPTAAEVRDGRFVVTELRGRTQSDFSILERSGAAYPGCEQFEAEWSGVSDLVLTKRGQ